MRDCKAGSYVSIRAELLALARDPLVDQYLYFHPPVLATPFGSTVIRYRANLTVAERCDHSAKGYVVVLLKVSHNGIGALLAECAIAGGVACRIGIPGDLDDVAFGVHRLGCKVIEGAFIFGGNDCAVNLEQDVHRILYGVVVQGRDSLVGLACFVARHSGHLARLFPPPSPCPDKLLFASSTGATLESTTFANFRSPESNRTFSATNWPS